MNIYPLFDNFDNDFMDEADGEGAGEEMVYGDGRRCVIQHRDDLGATESFLYLADGPGEIYRNHSFDPVWRE